VGQIVEPLLFGSQTRLSPLAVLLGTAFWTLLWGPVGLILAVPLTLAVTVMGQHIPHLEFLRVLLGNEPALQPPEQLYHQLLAGEAIQAAKEADLWMGEQTFESYLDEAAIPSFRVASDDQKRGVLGREQMAELKETVTEYIQLVNESLHFTREQQAGLAEARPYTFRPPQRRSSSPVAETSTSQYASSSRTPSGSISEFPRSVLHSAD
jgi:hypothetical protein